MTQLDDQTSTDANPMSTSGPSLAERVAAKLDHDGVSPANAAMTIGVSYPQLVSLLGGKKPPMKALLRIEAWLQGQPSDDGATKGATNGEGASTDNAESGIVEIVHDESLTEDPQAPAPRRRGRPSKAAASVPSSDGDETKATPSAPRKRGRPPKSASADADTSSAPKRRGRPPKARDADAAPKRRGRPPKNDRAAAAPAASKRRGRPPKAKTHDSVETPPKRRGRPPKHPQAMVPSEPKRRGRPPGSKRLSRQESALTSPAGLGDAWREIVALADDALAVAIHRAPKDLRARVAALLEG